nr:MAG: minor capsid protein 2 [Bacteriophage sp.]
MPKLNTVYDIGAAFEAIENELISSMIRNMRRHKLEEIDEDKQWAMWQALQLKSLEKYRKDNRKKYGKQFKDINAQIKTLISLSRSEGEMAQEIAILEAIRNGFPAKRISKGATAEFFKVNDRKLETLINATMNDMQKAEIAVLRMANDQYRKVIYNAQVYANTGAGTYKKAVDMATEDFVKAGLNCVQYANGARHTLADYADMAIRTASKRAYLQGEGQKRQEWGISTVIMNKRGNPCPKCLPFVGKVLVDDVWSNGPKDGKSPVTGIKYPLMSKAIAAGLYHPRCKDSHTTYFEGISTPPEKNRYTKAELNELVRKQEQENRQQYARRQEKKFGRLAEFSLDPENKEKYELKCKEWKHARMKTGNMNNQEYMDSKDLERIQGFEDITDEWKKTATPNSHDVEEIYKYKIKDSVFTVDGKNVLLDYSDKERRIAELLKEELGGKISLVPRVLNPQGVSTPDYIFRDEAFDLKELSGTSKNLVYNAIAKKKKQASNFILDISKSPLDENEITRQIEEIYWSRHTMFVQKIIVIKDEKIRKIYKRNREK